jgi:hypothetical protein
MKMFFLGIMVAYTPLLLILAIALWRLPGSETAEHQLPGLRYCLTLQTAFAASKSSITDAKSRSERPGRGHFAARLIKVDNS